MTSIREANACGIRGGHKFEPFFSNQPTAKSESIENATSQVVLKLYRKSVDISCMRIMAIGDVYELRVWVTSSSECS